MGLQNFASVFSRTFVVGYFVPVFVAVFLFDRVGTETLMPAEYRNAGGGEQLLVLGAIAVVVGIVLTGLNYSLLRLLEGYPFIHAKEGRLAYKLGDRRRSRWQERYDQLEKDFKEKPKGSRERNDAANELNDYFPAERSRVLPTRFGNAFRAIETHPRKRYNLNGVAIWPRIELLLSETELKTIEESQGSVSFFVNGAAMTPIAAVVLATDGAVNGAGFELFIRVAAALLGGAGLYWVAYRAATGALIRWGTGIRAAFDLHRFDLYDRLGVQTPHSHEDEKAISNVVNRCIQFAEPIPTRWRRSPS